MSNSNAVSNVHGPGSGDPLNALYVAAPSTNRPSKIGFAADVDRRACQVSRDLEMDFQPVWQQSHPAAPEIEARVKTVLSGITCDPNVFGLYTDELFAVRSEVVVAVAEAEIERFAAEMEASEKKNDMIPFRMMKGVAQDLVDYAEESGQTVSKVLRERVRGYLNGTIVLKPLPDVWDSSDGFPPASVARAAWRSRRFNHMQTVRLGISLARRLRIRAAWQGISCSALMRRLVLYSGPAPTGADASGGEDGPGEGESTGDEPPKGDSGEGSSSEGDSSEGGSGEGGSGEGGSGEGDAGPM
jgi:hypothetical protein